MRTNNMISVVGRLTADPELRTTSSGVEVASFTVAVDRGYVKDGEERQTDFIPCVAWKQRGVFINKYFSKGKMIHVAGALQTRKYEDKEGNKRTAFEINVEDAAFVGTKKDNDAPNTPSEPQPSTDKMDIAADDDLPF